MSHSLFPSKDFLLSASFLSLSLCLSVSAFALTFYLLLFLSLSLSLCLSVSTKRLFKGSMLAKVRLGYNKIKSNKTSFFQEKIKSDSKKNKKKTENNF
jgi:hypothetical protein